MLISQDEHCSQRYSLTPRVDGKKKKKKQILHAASTARDSKKKPAGRASHIIWSYWHALPAQ